MATLSPPLGGACRTNDKDASNFKPNSLSFKSKAAVPVRPQKSFPFFHLPQEIQFQIFTWLTPKDISYSSLVCQSFREFTIEQRLWRIIAKRDLTLAKTRTFSGINWKSYCRRSFKIRKSPDTLLKCSPMAICQAKPLGRFVQTADVCNKKIYFVGGQITTDKRLSNITSFDPSCELGKFDEINVDNRIMFTNEAQARTSTGALLTTVPKFARHVSGRWRDSIVVFGGFDGDSTFFGVAVFTPSDNTWVYKKTYGDLPPLRSNAAADVIGDKFYLFGGSNDSETGEYQVLGDFSVLDLESMVWTRLHEHGSVYTPDGDGQMRKRKTCKVKGDIPNGRVGHRLVGIEHKLHLIGGGIWGEAHGWTDHYYEMYIFDTKEMTWYLPASEKLPKDEQGHPPSICYPFTYRYKEYLSITTLAENAVWMFDTIAEKWHKLDLQGENGEGNIPTKSHSMGAVGVVHNNAYFLGSYHIGPNSSDNDFYRIAMGF
eukprot:TRINITY_DN5582_c0_g1_i1.p1 TRINITY_DN5582_c0_g1~~TRINITY_DN5582_c0_g1_i1.p1  ORF type:complete len:486 (+),score=54.97 TRINITY_DN5582_c0_g1_i1:50-1507(+)